MPDSRVRLVLQFRPWVWARTIIYEYFCMSWAMRVAAEHTRYPPLAARLVGESFELAIKTLNILARGPEQPLTHGHGLESLLNDVPKLAGLLSGLWGEDLKYVVSLVDGDKPHPILLDRPLD